MKIIGKIDISKVKLLVLDVDGTLTDGKIYIGVDGEVFKAFSVKDGCGIHDILPLFDIEPVVITARESKIVENRCTELDIRMLYQGIKNKEKLLKIICEQKGFLLNAEGEYDEVAYIGDDVIDLPAMKLAAIKACPVNACQQVLDLANIISDYEGGNGAVREIIEYLCNI